MRISILAPILLAIPAAAHAGDLSGKVYDATALPVAGATVLVGDVEVQTLADGSYAVSGLAAGEHEISVTLADGAVQTVFAEVAETGTARRNIFLVSRAAIAGARRFAEETTVADLPALPAAEGAVVAWRWNDSEA